MADNDSPVLVLQPNLERRPVGGAWWPEGHGMSLELLDLVSRWPVERPSIVRYAYLPDEWDLGPAPVSVPTADGDARAPHLRTRILVLSLSDRTSCRLLLIPPETDPAVARGLLLEAGDPWSTWKRPDFEALLHPSHDEDGVQLDGADA